MLALVDIQISPLHSHHLSERHLFDIINVVSTVLGLHHLLFEVEGEENGPVLPFYTDEFGTRFLP